MNLDEPGEMRLDRTARDVLLALCLYVRDDGDTCYPSIRALLGKARIESPSTIHLALNRLYEKKWVSRELRGNATNLFHVNVSAIRKYASWGVPRRKGVTEGALPGTGLLPESATRPGRGTPAVTGIPPETDPLAGSCGPDRAVKRGTGGGAPAASPETRASFPVTGKRGGRDAGTGDALAATGEALAVTGDAVVVTDDAVADTSSSKTVPGNRASSSDSTPPGTGTLTEAGMPACRFPVSRHTGSCEPKRAVKREMKRGGGGGAPAASFNPGEAFPGAGGRGAAAAAASKAMPGKEASSFISSAPDGIDGGLWSDWCRIRRSKRKFLVGTAEWEKCCTEFLEAGLTPQQGLQFCIERQWAKFEADWYRGALAREAGRPDSGEAGEGAAEARLSSAGAQDVATPVIFLGGDEPPPPPSGTGGAVLPGDEIEMMFREAWH